jgi:hypothetical protein
MRADHPTTLTLNEDLVVLAADIHPRQATVAIVDLDGRFLSRSTLPTGSDPVKSVASIVDWRPRGRWAMAPSCTQCSAINCSMICETVLRCRPENLARSARETGCRARISCRMMSRLIPRAVSLEASLTSVRSTRRMPFLGCHDLAKTSPHYEFGLTSDSKCCCHFTAHRNHVRFGPRDSNAPFDTVWVDAKAIFCALSAFRRPAAFKLTPLFVPTFALIV